ncbi:cysteine protease ATG4D-like [Actinia tenebrosa]|uniref:Cysteine protease n=1 Tax=Actinia tenebrosa TaxID=6105 RepID=A0A6P8I3K5_ACTTE|nr:cysteine protease ATG4D-like [Actinia tenebrosa]
MAADASAFNKKAKSPSKAGHQFSFLRQKAPEDKEGDDEDDDDLFDSEKLKTRLMSAWNNMRYGLSIPSKSTFNEDSPIWLLGRCYHAKNYEFCTSETKERCKILSMDEFKQHFMSLIWLTYRREFTQLNGSTLTSDCGWGCMLRSGQMMLASGLIFHFLKKDWRVTGRCNSTEQDHYYRNILRFFGDHDDEERSPFSLHRLVLFGQHAGKQAGDWYGPSSVAHILKKAMDTATHPLLHDINIYVAQDCTVYKEEVEYVCTNCRMHQGKCNRNGEWQSVIILVPVRLGGEAMNSIYIPCVKALFTLDQCIGIIGGRPKHSLYFVGFQEDKMIHLDPHYCQPFVDMKQKDFASESFHCPHPRKMSIKKMDPSCTIGFYCSSKKDFESFCAHASEILKPPMQKGDYPMFIFADKRTPMAPEASVRAVRYSESFTDHKYPPETDHDHKMLSRSPATEEYVLL